MRRAVVCTAVRLIVRRARLPPPSRCRGRWLASTSSGLRGGRLPLPCGLVHPSSSPHSGVA
eukprot:scaffold265903_cov31-Tisochrysis_lutea.AAC.1